MRRFWRSTLAGLLLTAAATPGAAEATSLWQDTEAGMTVAAVRHLYPTVETGPRERLHSGATSDLRLPRYAAAGGLFTVDFYFVEDRLQQVVLRLSDVGSFDRETALGLYDRLQALLAEKYGGSTTCQTARSTNTVEVCGWTTGDRTVDIAYADVRGQPVLFDIYYRALGSAAGGAL